MTVNRKPFSITLDEELIREAKKRAIDERKTLYEFVEGALRLALNPDRMHPNLDKVVLKSSPRASEFLGKTR